MFLFLNKKIILPLQYFKISTIKENCRSLKKRLSEHKSAIPRGDKTSPVARHCIEKDDSLEDLNKRTDPVGEVIWTKNFSRGCILDVQSMFNISWMDEWGLWCHLFYKWFMAGYVVCCLLLYGSCTYLVVYTVSVLEMPLLLLAVSCLNNDIGAPQWINSP